MVPHRDKPTSSASSKSVEELIKGLGSRDGDERKSARRQLEARGWQVVEPLVKALDDPDEQVRWSAAKALGNIGHPAAAAGLAAAMADDSFDVRWMAAEGLAKFGRSALEPLLHVLATRPDSPDLYLVAHYVVRHLLDEGFDDILRPVEAALDEIEPATGTPMVAKAALEKLGAA
ncbi:MAG: HEAT repeat domain-containing protein [Dehalococcoidia bacterium]|nr:HEAT repeat domain-containing protein [Dehalococcoidia bacterium]